jgi:hypothetical protein
MFRCRKQTVFGHRARLFGSGCLRALQVLTAGVLLLSAFQRVAFSYTDPGSGALILQMLAASFVGAVFYFRKILRWFKTGRKGTTAKGGNPEKMPGADHNKE